MQGESDPRVPVAELRRHGTPHDYVLLPGEGHGFFAPDTELIARARTERFLAAHLGGRREPLPEQRA